MSVNECPCDSSNSTGVPFKLTLTQLLLKAKSLQVDIQARELHLEFSNWISTHMRDIWTVKPGFYTEFQAGPT